MRVTTDIRYGLHSGFSPYLEHVHDLATDDALLRTWLIDHGVPEGSNDRRAAPSEKKKRKEFNSKKHALKNAMQQRLQEYYDGMIPVMVASRVAREAAIRGKTNPVLEDSRWWTMALWARQALIEQGKFTPVTRESNVGVGRPLTRVLSLNASGNKIAEAVYFLT